MSNFEFVFSLLVILLGLALAEVLGGLVRVIKRRPRLRIGWATSLLATWTACETALFWRVVWRARAVMPDISAALFGGFAITGLYYFASALVFPDDLEEGASLDDYFAQEHKKVIGALLAANTLAYALRPTVMGWASWTYMGPFDWGLQALYYVAGITALVSRRRGVVIASLAVLVLIDLGDPVESIIWPNF